MKYRIGSFIMLVVIHFLCLCRYGVPYLIGKIEKEKRFGLRYIINLATIYEVELRSKVISNFLSLSRPFSRLVPVLRFKMLVMSSNYYIKCLAIVEQKANEILYRPSIPRPVVNSKKSAPYSRPNFLNN